MQHSWYSSPSGQKPAYGTTVPEYGKTGAYSWMKSPRYNSFPHEAGSSPPARTGRWHTQQLPARGRFVATRVWMSGDYQHGVSVMDRHMARYTETAKLAAAMHDWVAAITPNVVNYTPVAPSMGKGVGLTEAPRGALDHWISLIGGKLSHYQIVTPTCWNGSPQDDQGNPGPLEQALIGTPIADVSQPVELPRVIHSFDPCTSCSVHIISPTGQDLGRFVVPL